MKKKKVWRYYCDYCKKSGCSAYHIQRHEGACTNNPGRHCNMCNVVQFNNKPIDELVEALGCGDRDGVDKLRELSEGCPACMLAAIRQSKLQLQTDEVDGWEQHFHVDFDYQMEKANFWSSYNDEMAEKASYY